MKMDKFKTIEDFLRKTEDKKIQILYGAGAVGRVIAEFLKNRGILITAYAVTALLENKEQEGIPVYSLEHILQSYELKDIHFIITAAGLNQTSIKKELDHRGINAYTELSEALIYRIVQDSRKKEARKAERNKEREGKTGKTIGFLKPGYLDLDYAEHRLIIDKIGGISYRAIPKETADFLSMDPYYEEKVGLYRSLTEACYCPEEYIPETDLIHTFNAVCETDISWCASFETIIPRVWPKTEEEYQYFLRLAETLKRPNCKALYALSQNAYDIQKDNLMSTLSLKDAELIMGKTKVLHPPQEVLITEEEFIKKHTVDKVHFIFVGRLFFIKGGREVLQALSEFEDRYEFKLTLISSFLYEDYFTNTSYEEMLHWKKVSKSKAWIDYYESLSNQAVLEKCREATVGLLPSVSETYGYAVLEMQACGCPVVTTNIRAFPENNNKECGWICNLPLDMFGSCAEKNTDAWSKILQQELKNCFQEIFDHPEEIRKKGKSAMERIHQFHAPEQYEKELKKCL